MSAMLGKLTKWDKAHKYKKGQNRSYTYLGLGFCQQNCKANFMHVYIPKHLKCRQNAEQNN